MKDCSGSLPLGNLILRSSRGEIIFELGFDFELGEKQVAQVDTGLRVALVVNSGNNTSVGNLTGPRQQRVASSGKQLSEDARLKFSSRRMAAGVAEITRGKERRNEDRMLDEWSQPAVCLLELRCNEIGVDIGISQHFKGTRIFCFEIGCDHVGYEPDRIVLIAEGFFLLVFCPRVLEGKGN